MRGVGDPLTVGERVAFYRRRRGLAQATLAGLVGRSEDWLSKIERGEREIRKLDVLVEVAHALRVTLGDLLGEPVLMEDEHKNDDVPAVRDALMAPQRLSRTLFSGSIEPEYVDPRPVAQWTEDAWSDYQGGRIGKVVAVLPRLIKAAQQMEAAGGDAGYKRRCASVSARIHHLAATTLSKVGAADLAWIAAERAMQAADTADDPLVLASAARSGTHALLAVGRFDDALQLGDAAARWLGPRMREGDPAALSLYGMLHLRSAVAAARDQERSVANELLSKAEEAAESLGDDANYWQTGFGPTNVALHRMSAGLDLGDIAFVVDHAGEIDAASLYQSQEDKARNRPVRPRIDEATGKRLYRATIADPSAEKERDKSISVDIAADVQPAPPEAVGNLLFGPVVLEGLTVQPRAEASGQAKWITWVVRATGLRAVGTPTGGRGSTKSGGDGTKAAA